LYDFLLKNLEAAAYLDVWENDPEMTDIIRNLMILDNCLVTPHVATMTKQANKRMHYFEI
jgi:phosphoglycerate dehydrogenase-like enzyme